MGISEQIFSFAHNRVTPRGPKAETFAALFSEEEIDALLAALARGREAWEEKAFNAAFARLSVWAQRTRVQTVLLECVFAGLLTINGFDRKGEPWFVESQEVAGKDEPILQ